MDEITFRLLRPESITRDVLDILNELSPTSKLTLGEARNIITLQLKSNHYTYVGYINENPVCMGSFIILIKLGQNGNRAALIEDVSVRHDMQKKGYGLMLVQFLCQKAETYKVYKIILNCNDNLIDFYRKCGFERMGNLMRKNLE